MATITIDNTNLCGEGLAAINAAYGPVLRTKVNCAKTPLVGSESYSLFKVPKGFVARHAVVNIVIGTATDGLTLSIGSNQKDGSGDQIVYNAALSAETEAATLLDVDLPTFDTNKNVTAKTVADDDTYIVVIPSADCSDAVFEVSLAGDFMLSPVDANS